MNIIKQFWFLLLFFIIGELISKIIPLPGNVIGFILLLIALKLTIVKESSIKSVSDFLLNNLAILFIPGGVGLIEVLHLFDGNILKILVIVIFTTILTMITTSLTIILLERIKK